MNSKKFLFIMCATIASGTLLGSESAKVLVDDYDRVPTAGNIKSFTLFDEYGAGPKLELEFIQAFAAIKDLDIKNGVVAAHEAASDAAYAWERSNGKLNEEQEKRMTPIKNAVALVRAKRNAESKKQSS